MPCSGGGEACHTHILVLHVVQGDQSREVVRVLVECCLQESRFNPYYGFLAARLAAVSKSHKVGRVREQCWCMHGHGVSPDVSCRLPLC